MLITSGVALLLVAIPAWAGAARSDHKTPPKCGHAKSRLLLADGQAEVYEAPEVLSEPELTVYGCAYKTGRPRALGGVSSQQERGEGGPGGESGVLKATLAGPIVAYAKSDSYETGGSRNLIVVRDLRTGRVLHEVPNGTPVKPEPPSEGIGTVVALVVKADGSVAWIVGTDPEDGTYQVHALDKAGNRVLAEGADIAPGSLALAGSTLYWTQGGQPQSATLQ